MSAPLWQTSITHRSVPVAELSTAIEALKATGLEFDSIEAEAPELGVWLVGLLGDPAKRADAGDALYFDGDEFVVEVPQP